MRNLKLGFALLLMVLAFGCADQDFIEESQPEEVTVDGQRGSIGEVPVDEPTEAIITIEYPIGFDRLQFLQENGPLLGLIKARQCPTDPNREVWRINYVTYEELQILLNSIFLDASPINYTTSNGTGADPIHPPYRTRTAPPPASGMPDMFPPNEVIVFYEDFCHESVNGDGSSTI